MDRERGAIMIQAEKLDQWGKRIGVVEVNPRDLVEVARQRDADRADLRFGVPLTQLCLTGKKADNGIYYYRVKRCDVVHLYRDAAYEAIWSVHPKLSGGWW